MEKKNGDKTIYRILETLTSCFPGNSKFIRIGGDEFLIITPNITKADMEDYIKMANKELDNKKEILHNSNITLVAKDSTQGSLAEIISLADNDVSNIKSKIKEEMQKINMTEHSTKRKIEESENNPIVLQTPKHISSLQKEKWDTLNDMLREAVDKHILDLRGSKNFRYKLIDSIEKDSDGEEQTIISDIKREAFSIIEAIKNLLTNNIQKKDDESSCNIFTSTFNCSFENAQLIDSIISNEISLDTLNESELSLVYDLGVNLLDTLTHDQNSRLLTKSYFRLHHADELEKSNKEYEVIHFSMFGIRPSNTAYGHFATDTRIQSTIPFLIHAFREKLGDKDFNNEAYPEFNPDDIFFLDQSGGNYLAFIPSEYALSKKEIEEIVETVNSHYTGDSDSTLKMASTSMENISTNTISEYIEETNFEDTQNEDCKNRFIDKFFVKFARFIKEDCDVKKDSLKRSSLEGITNQHAFEKVMQDCITFYCNEIDDYTSIQNQQFFLNNVFTAVINGEDFSNFKKELEKKKIRETETKNRQKQDCALLEL